MLRVSQTPCSCSPIRQPTCIFLPFPPAGFFNRQELIDAVAATGLPYEVVPNMGSLSFKQQVRGVVVGRVVWYCAILQAGWDELSAGGGPARPRGSGGESIGLSFSSGTNRPYWSISLAVRTSDSEIFMG